MAAQDKWPRLDPSATSESTQAGVPTGIGTQTATQEKPKSKGGHTCPTCGSALRLYAGESPLKRETGFCDPCGQRHKVKAPAKDD
jgi:hypothetical protein